MAVGAESEKLKAKRAVEAVFSTSSDNNILLLDTPSPPRDVPLSSPRIQYVGAAAVCIADRHEHNVDYTDLVLRLNFRFVPLSVPPNRRLQTTVVVIWGSILPLCMFLFLYLWYVESPRR